MNELLHLAERLIRANVAPDVARRYFDLKNQMMFRALAEPIARSQREKHEMKRTAERLQQEQPQDLASWVRFELMRIFTPFGHIPPAGDDPWAWAGRALKKAETEIRNEIGR
jgi:hypothetical protein